MAKEKLPPRAVVGKTVCMHKGCNEVATVKRDAGGYLFMSCPVCGTINNRRPSYQAALQQGIDAYNAEQETEAQDAEKQTPEKQEPEREKRGGLFGGLSIFSE